MAASPPLQASHSAMSLRSSDSVDLDLAHPTPDLQSLQGAYVGNIERLEEHAERMSNTGSELGEEIRKLQLEQKLSDSRQSSMYSRPDDGKAFSYTRSRNASTSSYANSIVDVNGQARWGGYSPGGFITSPVGSIRSGSWSQPSAQRQRSVSRASRLGQFVRTEEEDEQNMNEHNNHSTPPGSPPSGAVPTLASPKAPSHRSVSSFTRQYDQIAQEITEQLHNFPHHETQGAPDDHHLHPERDLPERPSTAASGDTYYQARTLFHDFDGVHCPPIEEDAAENAGSRNSSLLMSIPAPPPHVEPPPADGMVYYPAPVPKLLNLPKRLSHQPPASAREKRRTQLLHAMNDDARKSAVYLFDDPANRTDVPGGSPQKRKSMDARKSMASLPPQLRASVYFDSVSPTQEVEIKGESAEATLDSILEASAHAPVSAFTDHPYAGHVGAEVYGKEQHRKSTATLLSEDKLEARKSRSSLGNILSTRRNSSGDRLNKLQKRNSSHNLDELATRNSSRMSLEPELELNGEHVPIFDEDDNDNVGESTALRHSIEDDDRSHHDEAREEEEPFGTEEDSVANMFAPPTTLLAELQMRKAQQKTRNRTALTAFPNGMHSTLLELDAVAEIEKRRRQHHKVNLAWENPEMQAAQESDEDEDVPLGLLYPGRGGLMQQKKGEGKNNQDFHRPLGLIAQRELENHEPLSRRRTRLLGLDPRQPSPSNRPRFSMNLTPSPEPSQSQPLLASQTPTPPPHNNEEGETLAQRRRRLKNRETLNTALGDVQTRPISGEFLSEMMSQFGPASNEKEGEKDTSAAASPPANEEEETLGQRRARLQAQALAAGGSMNGNMLKPLPSNTTRPPLRASHSMADILAAHPLTAGTRKVSDETLISSLPPGSLLQKNEVRKTRHRADMLEQSRRSTSYGLDKPLVGDVKTKAPNDQALADKIQAFKGNVYDHSPGGTGAMSTTNLIPTPMTVPAMMPGMGFGGGYFGTPGMVGTPGMMPQSMPMNFMPMMQQPMMGMGGVGMPMNGYDFPPMSGMQPGMQGMPQMGMGMGMAYMDPGLDPRQRDMIDRWRQSVAQ